MSREPEHLLRFGRRLVWRMAYLYRPVGWLRKRNNPWLKDYDVWVGGYPRSSNTYTGKVLELHWPGARVVSQVHLPPPVLQGLREGKPGLLLIRKPADAVISWVQYSRFSLRHCLVYYVDFHRALLPSLPKLVVATFEETTQNFPRILERLNARYGLSLKPVPVDRDAVFKQIDDQWRTRDGALIESQTARPNEKRASGRKELEAKMNSDPKLRVLLNEAESLYRQFIAGLPTT